MEKFKLIGLTKEAYKKLCADDLAYGLNMVGCEVFESDEIFEDGKLYSTTDGRVAHEDFLILEQINDENHD